MSKPATISKFSNISKGKKIAVIGGLGIIVAGTLMLFYREELVERIKSIGPRGIRNNNPGNIRINTDAWKGMVPREQNTDGAFAQFETMEHGMRAQMITLRNYQKRYGLDTLRKVTHRWAPAGDGSNNPDNYAAFVADKVGTSPDAKIDLVNNPNLLANVARYMAIQENGWQWSTVLSLDKYKAAIALGLNGIYDDTMNDPELARHGIKTLWAA